MVVWQCGGLLVCVSVCTERNQILSECGLRSANAAIHLFQGRPRLFQPDDAKPRSACVL